MKKTNIRITGLLEREEREKGAESVFRETASETFPHVGKELDIQVQEANRTLYYLNEKRPPRHIIMQLSKINYKERILKAAREKMKVTYKGTPVRLSMDFSAETLRARKEWNDICKVLKDKNFQPRILYPAVILQI